jgi:hypothetical protein
MHKDGDFYRQKSWSWFLGQIEDVGGHGCQANTKEGSPLTIRIVSTLTVPSDLLIPA